MTARMFQSKETTPELIGIVCERKRLFFYSSSYEGDCQSGLCRACQFKDPRTVIRHNRYDDIGQRNSSEQSIKLCPVL